MGERRTYLDHNATAPLRPEARAAMIAALDAVGNPSSVHAEGRHARGLVENAREAVARLAGARPEEVVFTSGATEANNWVMRAGWSAIATSAIEHESVLAPARASGAALNVVPAGRDGVVDLAAIRSLEPPRHAEAAILSVQLANGETGILQPLDEVMALVPPGMRLHTDAVQAVGRIPVDFQELGVDMMSISAHKLGGPKGIGALVIRDGIDIPPLLCGGGQERRRRSGTENVAAIAGFGAAAEVARASLGDMARVAGLRVRLEAAVKQITPQARIIGEGSARIPNTSCIAAGGTDATSLLIKLDLVGIAVSAGSACSSGKIGRSHVLEAMEIESELARGAVRVSLGHTTTEADIDHFISAWAEIHRRPSVRNASRSGTLAVSRQPAAAAMRAGE